METKERRHLTKPNSVDEFVDMLIGYIRNHISVATGASPTIDFARAGSYFSLVRPVIACTSSSSLTNRWMISGYHHPSGLWTRAWVPSNRLRRVRCSGSNQNGSTDSGSSADGSLVVCYHNLVFVQLALGSEDHGSKRIWCGYAVSQANHIKYGS